MFDVVCVGSATQDVFIKSDLSKIISINDVLAEKSFLCYDYGAKVNIDNIEFLTGGGASNTAASFARLGRSCAVVGKVGRDDDAGKRVIDELKTEGVDVSFVAYSGSQQTGYSVILVSYEGDRTVLTFRGANNTFDEHDLDWKVLDETKWLYMSGLSGRSAEMAVTLAQRAHEKNVNLAFNPGSTQLKTRIKGLKPILSVTDILLMNREEAEMVTGLQAVRRHIDSQRCTQCGKCLEVCESGVFQMSDQGIVSRGLDMCNRCGECLKACPNGALVVEPWLYNMIEIFRALLDTGVKMAVITDGKAGAQVCDGKNLYFFPSYNAPVVDTLGAGDAFASAFVAGVIRDGDIARGLQLGTANSSSVIRYFGAKAGLLTMEEAEELIKKNESEKIYFVRKTPFDAPVQT